MSTPRRGLFAGLLALIVFAAGAVAMASHAPTATVPSVTGSVPTVDDGDHHHGGRFVGLRDQR